MTVGDSAAAQRAALRALVERYARSADTRDRERFVDCFTPDGILVSNSGREFQGPAELGSVTDHLSNYRKTMHLVGNHYVESLDRDEADGITYCIARHLVERDTGTVDYVMHIVYHDRYRRLADGWRIRRRELELLWDEEHPVGAVSP